MGNHCFRERHGCVILALLSKRITFGGGGAAGDAWLFEQIALSLQIHSSHVLVLYFPDRKYEAIVNELCAVQARSTSPLTFLYICMCIYPHLQLSKVMYVYAQWLST